ncbi:rap GTPase-activating protein, putative [Entamoeba invadens IP1]|uniref:Rap GTPase-activating protein, putative n=1 Tax=Entamoeba invadens IP1 TaxID=370355 RepID=A0A0A1TZP0_ENTIV|nr:rap GTPase-activating protein, putative [Entamoeba invadens IP1]ELP85650.1 rap GTPase-activating protein, putative [Entamoeba invadens IP1]|eukprot:XP_004184996.1 rap GTPase-activating protein, putative [Entamoeba invadens IP1]
MRANDGTPHLNSPLDMIQEILYTPQATPDQKEIVEVLEVSEIDRLKHEVQKLRKEKCDLEDLSRSNFMKEFHTFSLQFPLCGEQFESGVVDPSNGQLKYSVLFPKIFSAVPNLYTYLVSTHPTSIRVPDSQINKSYDGFTVHLKEVCDKGAMIFWFAYMPLQGTRKEFTEMTQLFQGNSVTIAQTEQPMMAYVRKYGANDCDENGKTLLHYVVEHGFVDMAMWLLEKGAYPNAGDKFRYTPLHVALGKQQCNVKLVELLIEKGGDVKLKNVQYRTPLHYLCRQMDIGKLLPILRKVLSSDANNFEFLNEVSSKGDSALNCLCNASLNIEALELLCSRGADVNTQTMSGDYPLYCAVKRNNSQAVRVLLQYNAKTNLKFYGKTIFEIAEEHKFTRELNEILHSCFLQPFLSQQQIEKMQKSFVTVTYPEEKWLTAVNPDKVALVDIATLPIGYHLENFYTCCTSTSEELKCYNTHDASLAIRYYEKHFDQKKHVNYIIALPTGIKVVSITDGLPKNTTFLDKVKKERNEVDGCEKEKKRKVIIWSKRGDLRREYPILTPDSQILSEAGFVGKTPSPIQSRQIYSALCKFEGSGVHNAVKVGVLYGAMGQITENQFYNNTEGSPFYMQFLKLLGDVVSVKGYVGYLGGLENGNYGAETLTTTFSNNEIQVAFHVSTLMNVNGKSVGVQDKRKLIQNDIVVVIFKEYNGIQEPIDITSFTSPTNHAFLIVGYDLDQPYSNTPKYDINLCVKNDVIPVPPFIMKEKYIFESALHDFIIAKIINAERASLRTDWFRGKKLTYRQTQLESICLNAKC